MPKLTKKQKNQSAFDRAVRGVIRQGGPSKSKSGGCAYRAPDGRRCPIGHLIKNERYRRTFEGAYVKKLADLGLVHPDLELTLLIDLQYAHDGSAIKTSSFATDAVFLTEFKARCRTIAKNFGLSAAVLDQG